VLSLAYTIIELWSNASFPIWNRSVHLQFNGDKSGHLVDEAKEENFSFKGWKVELLCFK